MWQVSGRSDITDFEEVVRLDTEYISKQKYTIVKRVTIENISADDVESKMRPNENLKNIF